jgi:hypothetical protein
VPTLHELCAGRSPNSTACAASRNLPAALLRSSAEAFETEEVSGFAVLARLEALDTHLLRLSAERAGTPKHARPDGDRTVSRASGATSYSWPRSWSPTVVPLRHNRSRVAHRWSPKAGVARSIRAGATNLEPLHRKGSRAFGVPCEASPSAPDMSICRRRPGGRGPARVCLVQTIRLVGPGARIVRSTTVVQVPRSRAYERAFDRVNVPRLDDIRLRRPAASSIGSVVLQRNRPRRHRAWPRMAWGRVSARPHGPERPSAGADLAVR